MNKNEHPDQLRASFISTDNLALLLTTAFVTAVAGSP